MFFFKSPNIPTAYFLLFKQLIISSVNSIIAIDVDLFPLNLYWLSVNNLCFSMKLSNLWINSFSSILENWQNRDRPVICVQMFIPGFV